MSKSISVTRSSSIIRLQVEVAIILSTNIINSITMILVSIPVAKFISIIRSLGKYISY